MKNPTLKVPALLTWRRAAHPIQIGIQIPLPTDPLRTAEQVAAAQEWDAEGGTIKPPIIPGPKIPL